MPTKQQIKEFLRMWGKAFLPTLIILAAGAFVTIVAFRWSQQSPAFWLGWLLIVIPVGIIFAIWAAANDFLPPWVRALIILGLMAATAFGLNLIFNSNLFANWSWTDFGLSIMCLFIIFIGAPGVNMFYKYRMTD